MVAAVFVLPGIAQAQNYPARPVRVLIPWPPGGSNDIVGRVVFQKMSEQLGQQFVIENRGGASGTIGSDLVSKAVADGYTLMVQSATHVANPHLYKKLPYDTLKDFVGLTPLAQQVGVIVVHPSLPAKTVKEFIALAKARPGQIVFASSGSGSFTHLTMALFNEMTQTKMLHVAYKGGGPALVGLITGEVQVAFMGVLSSKPFRKSGQVRALAVSTRQRSPAVPEIPTIDESGVPGYDKGGWTGMFAPARVPDAIIDHVYQAVAKALKDPEAVRRLADDGLVAVASSPAEFTKFVADEIVEWTKLTHAMHLEKRSLKGG